MIINFGTSLFSGILKLVIDLDLSISSGVSTIHKAIAVKLW
ncbi:hypothetical protein [Nostoc sp.]